MMIYTRFSRPKAVAVDMHNCCVVLEDTEVIKDGCCVVVPKGTVDLYAKVQADKESCDVYKILNRFARGDVSVISQRVGQFIDTVNMPTNLIDAHKQLDSMRRGFESMPAEFREKFGFSFDSFLEKGAKMNADDWKAIAGNPEVKTTEVIADVEK